MLTKNFKKSEFDSRDGSKMPSSVLVKIKELAKNLQVLRDYFNLPVSINSGYRSPKHNKAVGGVANSRHVKGEAADITVDGKTPKQVAEAIMKLQKEGKMKKGGVGLYNTFVHYDIRGYDAKWDYSSKYDF